MSDWILSIDFGTSYTTAAIRTGDGEPRLVEVSNPSGPQSRMASSVLVQADGEILVGWVADNQAQSSPEGYEPSPKRSLGRDKTLRLAARDVEVPDLVAAVLRAMLGEARRLKNQTQPQQVKLTHPASWGKLRIDALLDAAARAGIESPELIPEPVAAAMHFAAGQLSPGELVAVYDLGGGTFDTAVLKRTSPPEEFEVVAVGGREELGGEIFDERLFDHLVNVLREGSPENARAIQNDRRARIPFLREVRAAKEALSGATSYTLRLPLETDFKLELDREQLNAVIRDDVERSLDILATTIGDRLDDLEGIYLAGGSSRIKLVEDRVQERFGRHDTLDEPKSAIALGAARAPAPEPHRVSVAAEDLAAGQLIAVIDTGENDVDAAVLRRDAQGSFDVVRRADAPEQTTGADLLQRVLAAGGVDASALAGIYLAGSADPGLGAVVAERFGIEPASSPIGRSTWRTAPAPPVVVEPSGLGTRSELPWLKRQPVARVLAVAAGLLVALVLGVLAATGAIGGGSGDGNGSPIPTDVIPNPNYTDTTGDTDTGGGTSSFPASGAEADLYSHIPDAIQSSCDRGKPDDSHPDATIDCTAGDSGGIFVEYSVYSDRGAMYREYNSFTGGDRNTGSCPGRLPSESTWTASGKVAGRLYCYLFKGDPYVLWTDDDLLIFAYASSSGTMTSLHYWWRNDDSGPD